jgi:cytochrome c-type biogenesis protein CcmH
MSRTTRRWVWVALVIVAAGLLAAGAGRAPTEGSSENRLFAIGNRMKCLQCTGESVSDSQAPIAVQMRTEIRRQMQLGRTDDEIYTFFVERYGSRVLLTPGSTGFAAVVWVLPVVAVGVGAVGLAFVFGRTRRAPTTATDDDKSLVDDARRDGEGAPG